METPHQVDAVFDYSMRAYEIAKELKELCGSHADEVVDDESYSARMADLAGQSLTYLGEGLRRFRDEFPLDIEAETFARAMPAEDRAVFALTFVNLLHASIGEQSRPIDAITDSDRLQRAVQLTSFSDHLNSKNFYNRSNLVRAMGDAVVGRAVHSMLALNVDPNRLKIHLRP